jgi:hypothetical protein
VSADQTPNTVAATIPAKPMIPSLRIVILPSSRVKALQPRTGPPPACDRCHKMAEISPNREHWRAQSERRIASRAERGGPSPRKEQSPKHECSEQN